MFTPGTIKAAFLAEVERWHSQPQPQGSHIKDYALNPKRVEHSVDEKTGNITFVIEIAQSEYIRGRHSFSGWDKDAVIASKVGEAIGEVVAPILVKNLIKRVCLMLFWLIVAVLGLVFAFVFVSSTGKAIAITSMLVAGIGMIWNAMGWALPFRMKGRRHGKKDT